MTIAREEIFGPVVTIIPYEDDEDAIRIANDTDYGLSAVVSGDPAKAKAFVPRLRAGMVYVNAGNPDPSLPVGGYKQSGNGREYGKYGLAEFMEVKSVVGDLGQGRRQIGRAAWWEQGWKYVWDWGGGDK